MINIERDERVLQIKLDLPPLNVLDTALCNELTSRLKEHSKDETLAAVVISGSGKCFSSGASVEEHKREYAADMVNALADCCEAIAGMPVPVVAQVHGFCFGGAFELVMYCDFVIADPGASFGVPEVTLAFFPPLACSALPGIVGRQNAAHLVFSGARVDAKRAMDMGIVQEITEQADWGKMVKRFNRTSAPVLRLAKEALAQGINSPEDRFARAITRDLFLDKLYRLEDVNEGIASFTEKRKPQWRHG
jgi:cyclohexa-1,5-dienecarbonyl-CoA hydratase